MTSATEHDEVVKAVIHPSIGVGRVGNSPSEYFIGPEVPDAPPPSPGFYRDGAGALKRQAARLRIYGVNGAGKIVAELTGDPAVEVAWTVHLANHKAAWHEFQIALDIPEAASAPPSFLRNGSIGDRSSLVIDGGPISVSGRNVGRGGAPAPVSAGRFLGTDVYLGELHTDDAGRLVVLGGRGTSAAPSGARAITFANNDGWYDDISDGPVTASVTLAGRSLQVDPAWVVIAPPNYAPALKSVRTMWDLMRDVAVKAKMLAKPERPSFTHDIAPIFRRLNDLQWVNAGFAAAFGWGGPFDLASQHWLERLSRCDDDTGELRRTLANNFRDPHRDGQSPVPWPWLYGDAMSIPAIPSVRQNAFLSDLQLGFLDQWADGDFEPGYEPDAGLATIDDVPIGEQGETLDRAALEYCLADAFHPGCEMTWPMRQAMMYMAPFRIKHAPAGAVQPSYGITLDSSALTLPEGPLGPQFPGGLTRWMAVPWQTDTASCRSGYDRDYDPYLPTFWPARVPNEVLDAANYRVITDLSKPMAERLKAFSTRSSWLAPLGSASYTDQINNMIHHFDHMGIVETYDGPGDPEFPSVLRVQHDASGTSLHAPERDETADVVDVSGIDKVRRFPHGLRT